MYHFYFSFIRYNIKSPNTKMLIEKPEMQAMSQQGRIRSVWKKEEDRDGVPGDLFGKERASDIGCKPQITHQTL